MFSFRKVINYSAIRSAVRHKNVLSNLKSRLKSARLVDTFLVG